jgi:predicted phosphoribosyltransferase
MLQEDTQRMAEMYFTDRTEAGKCLAEALSGYCRDDVVVLALPRGGVQVATEVAAALDAPLDLLLVRKIGVPGQPELAMGAVLDGIDPITVRNDHIIRLAWVSAAEFNAARDSELLELERRRQRYLGDRRPIDIYGRTVIVIDDGVATGATVKAGMRGLRRRDPGKIILAIPVAPYDTVARLRKEADEVVCIEQPEFFEAIGSYYRDFRQLSDEDVVEALCAAEARRAKAPAVAPEDRSRTAEKLKSGARPAENTRPLFG